MTLPRDAIELEDFQLIEKGFPPRSRVKVRKPEPEPPHVLDRVKFESIPLSPIVDFEARGRAVKNDEGMMFTGFNFSVTFEGGEIISGWLPENEFLQLKKRIPPGRIDLLQKIGW